MDDVARAIEEFLRADPGRWSELAPELVRAVGEERLAAAVGRLGAVQRVIDTPAGLAAVGPDGTVPVWGRVDAAGRLTGLLIAPGSGGGRTSRRAELVGHLVPFALVAVGAVGCWTAGSRTQWYGALLGLAAFLVLFEALLAPGFRPWWARYPVEVAALGGLVSVVRLPGPGGTAGELVPGIVLLAAAVALAGWAWTRRAAPALDPPLERWPLDGRWYVVQGGGSRLINHHVIVDEQRGAVDLVRTGPTGPYRGDPRRLASHLCYGEPVYAPCAGTVVAAVDGIEDQVPGTIRYGPPAGNHVVLDTGTARVTLAHLRPGTVAVTPGEQVEVGRLLGEVGNSGNTTAPHLHLHAEHDGHGLELRVGKSRTRRGRTVS